MGKVLNWAVAGTGWIATDMAEILKEHGRGFYGVASGHVENARHYAEKYQVPRVYETIEQLCADPAVDVVYVATPHNTHFEIAKKALTAGKHCLIEKSITLNSRELEELVAIANEQQLCIAEAMTTWHMPVMKELKILVDSGILGRVQVINVNFGSMKPYDMENRFFNLKYAGGALLDIGVYALSAIRLFLEEKPTEVLSQWKLCQAGSDEEETILLKNAAGQMAAAVVSLHSKQPKRAMISCEKGFIEIMEYPRAKRAEITFADTGEKQILELGDPKDALYYEVQDFEAVVRQWAAACEAAGERAAECTEDAPERDAMNQRMGAMQLQYTRENMEVMTELRKQWNMKYPGEVW
ncbi:MAG: Gfo/Idh/MocA family oxidoreductase [Lachnospiraceae bacterium]|nr:Gfo/Idh/MocA family oxidoreductase [Lachnospiraceae bacterium]